MYINKNVKSANHIFYIRTKMRDKLRRFLFKKKPTIIHYPIIPPLQSCYKKNF